MIAFKTRRSPVQIIAENFRFSLVVLRSNVGKAKFRRSKQARYNEFSEVEEHTGSTSL
jgi:hypothetical protein